MDNFIVRKKRKLSIDDSIPISVTKPASPARGESAKGQSARESDDDESTDFKLALLSSLRPEMDPNFLLDILLAHEGSVDKASASLTTTGSPARKSAATGYQSSLSSFATPSRSEPSKKKVKILSKKGKTLHLYSSEDVATHTPCSIIHNFLPPEEANSLLEELLLEAPTYERMTFKLFDNVVQSPHTMCFYVESLEEQNRQKTEYTYNGGRMTVSVLF